MKNIADTLKTTKLIGDGAFGTYFQLQHEGLPERANIENKTLVQKIHSEYIDAGANFIRTNSFASNQTALGTDVKGVLENIEGAVAAARHAKLLSKKDIFIAGDIGPMPVENHREREDVINEYIAIGSKFQDLNVDIILFETFPELDIILPVIKYLNKRKSSFIMVSFSVNQFGYSNAGLSARRLFREASSIDEIDAIGFNCGVGPSHMAQIVKNLDIHGDKFVSVFPNAGYPKMLQNRLTFTDNSDYFEEKMKELAEHGVDILGGCCGTTPEYIKRLSQISCDITEKKPQNKQGVSAQNNITDNCFINSENKEHKLIAVELAPPAIANDEKLIEAAHELAVQKVDVVTFPDSPSGRTRADSILMAEKVHRETGLKVMPHICCRDKNAIALRSQILGASINGIDNFLVITGDPVPMTFRQTTSSVFNFDAVGLMKILQGMNEEVFEYNPISYGGAINQNRINIQVEVERVKKKMAAGARFFLTQPVFSQSEVNILRDIKNETGATILVGLMPLVSRKNALFMKNEMTGINITDQLIDRYDSEFTREQGEKMGIEIAKEFMAATADFADGYYFSFPFNRVHMLKKIL